MNLKHIPRILFVAAFIGCLIGSAWKSALGDDWLLMTLIVGAIVF